MRSGSTGVGGHTVLTSGRAGGDEYGRVAGGVSVERAQKGADRKNVSTSDPTEPVATADPTVPNQSSVYVHTLVRFVLPYVCAAVVFYRVRVYTVVFGPP